MALALQSVVRSTDNSTGAFRPMYIVQINMIRDSSAEKKLVKNLVKSGQGAKRGQPFLASFGVSCLTAV